MIESIAACVYLLALVSFVDCATRHDGFGAILKSAAWLSLKFNLGFLAIALILYVLNLFLFY